MLDIDCETLLAPLPGDSPEGDESHFAFTLAPALRELRREEAADEFSDSTRPANLKRADWPEAARQCQDGLTTKAKDLRTACHLLEARTRLEGLAGLDAGLELIARLVEECWERVTPLVGEDAAEARATPLANMLDDPDRGVCFPSLLRTLPLIGAEEKGYSYAEWTRMRSGRTSEDTEQLAGVRQKTTPERFKQLYEDAASAAGWVDRLNAALDQQLGDSAPGLLNLRTAIGDLKGLLGEELARLGYPTVEAAVPTEDHAALVSTTPVGPLGGDQREQLYTRLEETAERLRAMEPHSPIPYLIKRAVRLGRLPFPSLMQHLIREPLVLSEINREFGIAEPDEAEVLA